MIGKFYNLYITTVVDIISRCDLRLQVHDRNQLNKTNLALCKLFGQILLLNITVVQEAVVMINGDQYFRNQSSNYIAETFYNRSKLKSCLCFLATYLIGNVMII